MDRASDYGSEGWGFESLQACEPHEEFHDFVRFSLFLTLKGSYMVSSSATTVGQYLQQIEPARRQDMETLVELIRGNIQPGHQEGMTFGMFGWQVPLEVSGPTYNKQPLAPVALAVQKNHISLYLMSIYASQELTDEFQSRWESSGKKLDMGKACIRIKSLDHADFATIAWAVGLLTPKEFTEMYLKSRAEYQAPRKS